MDQRVRLDGNEGHVRADAVEIELSCEIDDVLTYAIQHNGANIIRDIGVRNSSDHDIDDLIVTIDAGSDLAEVSEFGIQKIKPGEELHFKNVKMRIHADYLASLTERIVCGLAVRVCSGQDVLASETKDIAVLAFDQWPGLQYTPELLVAFAMPNHPVVNSLLQLSSKYLEQWTQDPSLAGYQFKDPNRVKAMAAAAYAAIQQKNITYAEPPSSFEQFGQRIRLADAVLDQHMGTCMDMTLLYVACLEAMGLNPVMVMMRGHIFAGVWLMEESFPDMIMDDPSQLEKRMSKGIHEMIVVECTAMCAGKTSSFDEAIAFAKRRVSDYGKFAFAIDVRRARSLGIRPLPVRVKTDVGFEVRHEEREEQEITSAPVAIKDMFDLSNSKSEVPVTKQTQWERKLLDMSLRNMLINMRMTKAVVPLLSADITVLEDALAEGEEFQVLPRPADMSVSGDDIPVEALGELGMFADFIALESKHRRLHSLFSEKELNSCLTKMYRSAKTSMEENGASTLYLALGMLRWFENKKEASARYAPLVLVPIDIKRKSAGKVYAMHMRDEDAQVNITLLEFLKQNYDLQIPGLNPPPMDEHGLNLSKIFAIVRHGVMNLSMWDVVEAGFIGNFSFSQFVMWNDIHSRSDFLENNKIVRSLMKGAVDWDCRVPDGMDTDDAYLPVTTDSSQLRAINMAAEGVSFVLHGPPGTGKSQTITAMVANALTKGKTVLFVAEKMAALEVVQKRLSALGIQDFCMELHSNKTTKKAVLDQLKRGLEVHAGGKQTDYDKKIQDIRNMRSALDAYVRALHAQRPFGKSLRHLIDVYEMIPESETHVKFDHTYAGTLTESNLDHQVQSLERLIAAGKEVGHPHKHPLIAVLQDEYSQSLKFDLEEIVLAYKASLEKLEEDGTLFVRQLGLEQPVTEAEWQKVCKYADSIAASKSIPEFLRNAELADKEFSVPKAYLEKRDVFTSRKAALLLQWNENFLRMDMGAFREMYDNANKKFFGKGKALAVLTKELQAYASFSVETEKIPVYLTDVTFYKQEAEEMEALESQLSYEWKKVIQDYPTYEALQQYQDVVNVQIQMLRELSKPIRSMEAAGSFDGCIQLADRMITDWNMVKEREAATDELLMLSFEDEGNWMESRRILCGGILEHASSIKDWIVYRQFARECRGQGLGPVCDAYESGMPHELVMNVYLKSIYRAIILSVIEQEPVLNEFTGTGFNERILQFKKSDQEFMELTKEEMFYRLTHQLPTGHESVEISKELNILRRAISSNGRGVSIRGLFEQIPHILTKFCPCMLMSPISVAQYIAAENDLFDIVVFDEASQLPTCKAVGVLARGKNAVIVGDPNQMPPTSFFAGNTVDEDNLEIEDLDSILDDCLALGIPQAHLHWHYRSRHESLIAFSNQEFYEGSMLTFPSVNDREKRVNLVKVDGFFERGKGRINEGEAKAIVAEIRRRYSDPELTEQTVGVVTFNISQQMLIEDLLQEEYQKDAAFDNWANVREEPMFVKNLENVQGDERDVILFSIAFGPDSEGKLSLNFGPLNKGGGWKRLNVAVTRARLEMVVFTTMTADMIDLRRTKSKGVESLKGFLEFSEKGRLRTDYADDGSQKIQGMMEHICQRIEDAGYQYQKAVGYSRFKVDIAVQNPYNEEEYLLGIMLDGESYRQSSNTKDREVAQISVLEGLGWKLHRIWTMDWWDNREKEITRLLEILEQEKGTGPEVSCISREENQEPVWDIGKRFEPKELLPEGAEQKFAGMPLFLEAESMEYRVADYVAADLEVTPVSTMTYAENDSMTEIIERLQIIIDTEAPISYDRLVKKVLRSFDIGRTSTQTMEATDKAIRKVAAQVNKQAGVTFYWRKDQNFASYRIYRCDTNSEEKRSPDEICQQELKNAICVTLRERGPLDKESLIRAVVRTMGYARSGTALAAAVERGLKFGRKTGEIQQDEQKNFVMRQTNPIVM